MGKKVFLVDVDYCNGCHNCQVACKDEHCGTDWLPYAAEQPATGQFWCQVEEKVRGTVPKVRISYLPHFGGQSDALAAAAGDCLQKRDDGLVVLDPQAAKGRKDLAAFPGVFWNEGLQLPQACTGCAHLIDDGVDLPHCVDSCATGALRFGDEDDFADELARAQHLGDGTNAYYLNLPQRFVAGEAYDPEADEVLIGATVRLLKGESEVAVVQTDEFGDFWFEQVKPDAYSVEVVAPEGYFNRTVAADATDVDVNVGSIDVHRQPPLARRSIND